MKIKAFKAFRFNTAVVGDAGSCVAAPYDIISPDQQQQLYEKSEYNIVRVIKGKTANSDNDADNQYTRAADFLNSWIEKQVLKQDAAATIYAYVQDFQALDTHFQRFSFIALGRLEEFGKIVRPHEQTLSGPKIDRLNLKRATAADFGLVFMLYDDKQAVADKLIEKAAKQPALVDFTDAQGVGHRLFAITADDETAAITEMMRDKSCVIADGHHRYETALNYFKQTRNPAAAWKMLALTNMNHEGLIVLATHRLLANLENFSAEKLLTDLKENFEITELAFDSPQQKAEAKQKTLAQMKAQCSLDKNAFGIYAGNKAFYVAVLKNTQAMDSAAPGTSAAWRSLDVAVLHKLILEKLLGLDEKKLTAGGNLQYVKDTPGAIDDSIAKVDAGQVQAAVFTNPPKVAQIQMTAEAGEKMPQKSTYFYPKVYTGLTIYKF